ncbi:hypothetical protein ACV07N_00260 [Roseivirga echinicomitans]
MRRVINLCFFLLAIVAVIFGLIMRYTKGKTMAPASGISNERPIEPDLNLEASPN